MSDLISARVADHFTSSVCDLTPVSVRHEACVLYLPASRDSEFTGHCAAILSDSERARADRLASDKDKALFLQRRAFRRYCGATALGSSKALSQIAFEETENGRPFLSDSPDTWYSFSSCGFGFLGAWSLSCGIGVDIEDQTRSLEAVELAHQYFSEAEAKVVEGEAGSERLRIFFQFWCLKEAALKSIGEGLPFGLQAFEFELTPNVHLVQAPAEYGGPAQFSVSMIEGAGRCAALAIRQQV